jgi:nucleoside-diphosphate-sugar epimerase
MARTALVVGGTGPTGPHVVSGLRARGFEVIILHRGTHEIPELDDLEHIHADPHFEENISTALAGRRFDVVVAMYGRLQHVATALAGSCGQLVAVSGAPAYAQYHDPAAGWPEGMSIGTGEETTETAATGDQPAARFAAKIRSAEQHVLALHATGAFSASLFRYPSIYGPRQLFPREWSIIRRVRDGRGYAILPDAGLTISTRCAAENAAAYLLAAVDRPDGAAGEIFNVGDLQQYSLRQWAQMVSHYAGREIKLVALPLALAGPARALFPMGHSHHGLLSVAKAQRLLGYEEAVSAREAIESTVRWYVANPPDPAALASYPDRFDYEAEDRIIEGYDRAISSLLDAQPAPIAVSHPYAHPKAPGVIDHRGR